MTKIASSAGSTAFHVSDIPDTFYCPISCDIMEDPVTIVGDPTHQSYERRELERWFSCCLGPKRAPTSNLIFDNPVLVSNTALKTEIALRLRPDSVPSAPPMPDDTYMTMPAPLRTTSPILSATPPLQSHRQPPCAPSAPLLPQTPQATRLPMATTVPSEVGATASDFKNIIALGRSHIGHEIQSSKTLASIVAATAGAVGGLTGTAAVAVGVSCGLALAPCLAFLAGVGVLAAGTGVGVWIRHRKAKTAKSKPDIARKLEVLHEMRRAFAQLSHPTAAEKSVLKDVKKAINLVDSPRNDWIQSIQWAAGAALIAIPLGILVGLHVARQVQPQQNADEAENSSSKSASTARTTKKTDAAPSGTTYNVHVGPSYSTRLDAFSQMASNLLLKHQFGKTSLSPYESWFNRAADADDSSLRVPMKASWLAALDAHSYARLASIEMTSH